MPTPKHREPLVKKAIVVTERQWDALEGRAREQERSVSFLVREAIDGYLLTCAAPEPEKVETPA